jgi:hypothetical protein
MHDEDRILEFNEQVLKEAKELGLLDKTDSETEKSLDSGTNEEKLPSGNNSLKMSDTESKVTEREYSDVEKEQMELGWDPEKTGPSAVSAEEFKRVGQIIEAKRAASKRADIANKEVQELTKTVRNLVEHNKKVEKAAYAKALTDLQSERDEKISLGDVQGVKDLDLKEKVLLKAQESVDIELPTPETPQSLSPELDSYRERNKFWLEGTSPEDRKMQILANKAIDYLREAEPNIDEKSAIAYIESAVQTQFKTKFANLNKEKAQSVMTSTSTKSSGKLSSLGDLSSDERSTFLAIQKVDKAYTLEEFSKQLELIGRRA